MLFDDVDDLSEEDAPAASPKPKPKLGPRKARSHKIRRSKPVPDSNLYQELLSKPDALEKRLSRECGCRAGTCTSQFLEPSRVKDYTEYLERWASLAKLDQDQIVPWRCCFFLWELCSSSDFFCCGKKCSSNSFVPRLRPLNP